VSGRTSRREPRPAAARAALLRLCRRLPATTEDLKWGQDLVFSVGGKMYAVFDLESTAKAAFKVSPPLFASLTRRPGIVPAPYLARHHWVLVETAGALPREVLEQLLAESHALVAEKLPRRTRRELGLEPGPAAPAVGGGAGAKGRRDPRGPRG
jgi:predicted DNA-binding protein (MmcQ/YjbR family)